MLWWKKKIKKKIEGSCPTDPSNLLLTDLNLFWLKVPIGTRFKYYNPNDKKDIIPGEGGFVIAELKHSPKYRETSIYDSLFFYSISHKFVNYYLCSFRDKIVLIDSKEIRIVGPKKAKKKAKKK